MDRVHPWRRLRRSARTRAWRSVRDDLDHVLGATAHKPGRPAVTGTLSVRYLRGTPLGPLHAEAHVDRVEGVKTFASGHMADAQGITVRAEGVFVHPRNRGTNS